MKVEHAASWVVLFGGAGREGVVLRLYAEGVPVRAVIVPKQRSARLERSIDVLRRENAPIFETTRATLPGVMREFRGEGLLSVGFPLVIPAELLQCFRPAINIHPTLLPRYRGPTTAAHILINNERESGSTVHLMEALPDRGDILAQSRVALSPFDTVRSMQRKVYATEPDLVINALNALRQGAEPRAQNERLASEYPRRRTPEDSEVDPSRSLSSLFNHIRASDQDEFPAFFYYMGEKVCIKFWRPEKPPGADDEI
jgi:methionyl-tRNA formyltransferase